MKRTFSEQGNALVENIMFSIVPKLPFQGEINFTKCEVKVLEDDYSTVWVKWGGKFDCQFIDLPAYAMCTIADNILN